MRNKQYSKIPHEALRQIVDEFGECILTESRLKSILSDVLIGNDKIIKMIEHAIKDKVGVHLLALQKLDEADKAMRLSNIRQSFQEDNSFQHEMSNYVIDSFIYALEWIDHVEEYTESLIQKPLSTQNTKPVTTSIPEKISAPEIKLPQEIDNPLSSPRTSKKRQLSVIIILLFILITFGYFFFFYKSNHSSYYTIVNTTNLYSKAEETNTFIIAQIPYGSKLIVNTNNSKWSSVEYNNKKGYIISSHILPQKDFDLLNSIFGNSESYQCVSYPRHRLALLDYYKKNGLYGGSDFKSGQINKKETSSWQVYTKNVNEKNNSVFFPTLYNPNSKFSDFAVIIRNNNTEERLLIYYSFSDEEVPIFRFDENAPPIGNINSMTAKGHNVITSYTSN